MKKSYSALAMQALCALQCAKNCIDRSNADAILKVEMAIEAIKSGTPSREGRCLRVGDFAVTDFTGSITKVMVTEVHKPGFGCQSGIKFKVTPAINKSSPDALYDADWFHPWAGD